jgi:hypothetical protein
VLCSSFVFLIFETAMSASFLRRFFVRQVSAARASGVEVIPEVAAFSASCCCFRNDSSSSVVSFLTAASLAFSREIIESRKSTSSSSRERNWFLSFDCSSNSACLFAEWKNQQRQQLRPRCSLYKTSRTFVGLQHFVKTFTILLLAQLRLRLRTDGFELLLRLGPRILTGCVLDCSFSLSTSSCNKTRHRARKRVKTAQ